MVTKTLTTFFLFLFFTFNAIAQNKIYFVDDANEKGEPIGHSAVWAITEEGGNINILYTNNKKTITDAQLTILLQKTNAEGTYEEYAEYSADIEKGKTWLLVSIPFSEIGNYKVIIQNAAKKNLAAENIEIVAAEPAQVFEDIDDEHAKQYTIAFCDSVTNEGELINARKEFKLNKGKAKVVVYFSHPVSLNANRFTLKITNPDGTNEEIVLETDSTWPNFYDSITVTKPGKYTIAVISPSGMVLNFDIITVK